jgi:hypothetical protein
MAFAFSLLHWAHCYFPCFRLCFIEVLSLFIFYISFLMNGCTSEWLYFWDSDPTSCISVPQLKSQRIYIILRWTPPHSTCTTPIKVPKQLYLSPLNTTTFNMYYPNYSPKAIVSFSPEHPHIQQTQPQSKSHTVSIVFPWTPTHSKFICRKIVT